MSRTACFFGALLLASIAMPASAELRPLVREMLENLAALNSINQGVALEDFERLKVVASELEKRASDLQKLDLASVGLDPAQDSAFDAFLSAQKEAAKAIGEAARRKDASAVVLSAQRLSAEACMSCHSVFRVRSHKLRPPVMLMTTLLSLSYDLNRGLMLDDFDLVMRRAREMQGIARVFTWDQVIEQNFGVEDDAKRARFAALMRELVSQASRIEQAATAANADLVAQSVRAMWDNACITCHTEFRGRLSEK